MYLFIPRSLCALKRMVAKSEHARFGATTGIHLWTADGMYRAEATDGRRAIVVQGMVPETTPNWPGLKEVPDDAFETVLSPKDLEKGCKVGDEYLQKTFGVIGMATKGSQVLMGVGEDCIVTRPLEGRFPDIQNVIPRKAPLYSVPVDPRLLAEALLTIADLLPEGSQGVDLFYYGEGFPIGLCAHNAETGAMIDALVVPLTVQKQSEPQPHDPIEEVEEIEGQEVEEFEEQEVEAVEGEHAVEEEVEEPVEQPEPEPEEPAEPAEEPVEPKRRRRKTAKA